MSSWTGIGLVVVALAVVLDIAWTARNTAQTVTNTRAIYEQLAAISDKLDKIIANLPTS